MYGGIVYRLLGSKDHPSIGEQGLGTFRARSAWRAFSTGLAYPWLCLMLFLLSSFAWAVVPYDAEALLSRLEETQAWRSLLKAPGHPEIPTSSYLKAASGEIETGVEAKKGWGVAVFDIPIEHFWAAINDGLNHTGLTPIGYTELIRGQPCRDGRQVLMILPIPIIDDRWWVIGTYTNTELHRQSAGQTREMHWHQVDGFQPASLSEETRNRIDGMVHVSFTQGAWLLVQLDSGHTLGEYHSWVDPGGYIPSGPASPLAALGISRTFEAMETYAKTNRDIYCSGN